MLAAVFAGQPHQKVFRIVLRPKPNSMALIEVPLLSRAMCANCPELSRGSSASVRKKITSGAIRKAMLVRLRAGWRRRP